MRLIAETFARVFDADLDLVRQRLDAHRHGAVGRCVPEGVRHEVEENALDLLRCEDRGHSIVDVSDERHVPEPRLGLDSAQARVDDRCEWRDVQFERQNPGVDPRQLEQVVDEEGEHADLLPQCRQVVGRVGQAVLERFEHRLHVGERRAQVVTRPCDELAPGVEQLLDVVCHLVERRREIGDLRGAGLRRASCEVTACESARSRVDAVERLRDRMREVEAGHDGDCCRRGGDGEDLHVVAHVEHHPAGEQHRCQRQSHGEHREAGQLQPDGGQQAKEEDESEPDRECRRGDGERVDDHGTSR